MRNAKKPTKMWRDSKGRFISSKPKHITNSPTHKPGEIIFSYAQPPDPNISFTTNSNPYTYGAYRVPPVNHSDGYLKWEDAKTPERFTSGYIAPAEQEKESYLQRMFNFLKYRGKQKKLAMYSITFPSSHIDVKVSDLTFFKVLSVLSLLTSTTVALMNNWQFSILVQRFENLKWLVTGFHPGLH